MISYPKIRSVKALRDRKIKVIFQNGDIKIYDCRPLLADEPFKALEDDALFRAVRAEKHGYAVIWNDEIDLADSEIWLNGRSEVS
ncbi:MAG: DUF2442 domain-containing protein [Acidobacteria bacterium]|jgi:hypothetical protein|nr:DUF2442 domain-containing protein [Acidobacteriota bacterium]